MAATGLFQGLVEVLQFPLTPDKARQTSPRCGLKRRRTGPAPITSKTSTGAVIPFIGTGPRAFTWT